MWPCPLPRTLSVNLVSSLPFSNSTQQDLCSRDYGTLGAVPSRPDSGVMSTCCQMGLRLGAGPRAGILCSSGLPT